MLDDNPVLKERLMACGAFAGIALFAVAAVDVMISGGFDFGARQADYNRQQPAAYVRVVDAANYVGERFRSISWETPALIDSADATTTETLVGENDGSLPPDTTSSVSNEDLKQQIVALYESEDAAYETDGADYESIPDDQSYSDMSDAEADKAASAYENASPW